MDATNDMTRLVTALEKTLLTDHDGSIHSNLFNQLEAISQRLESETKKLHEKTMHLQIEGARQAINGALVAMKIIDSNRGSGN